VSLHHPCGYGPWRICLVVLTALMLSSSAHSAAQTPAPSFVNIVSSADIEFRQENGASPAKYMPETMGGGGLFFDYDNDGWLDIFLVNGGSFVNQTVARNANHRLYRNNGNGTFTDRSAASGIRASGYGMGACSADYDRDGRADLYITSTGPNRLYRNAGSGAFVDVTEKSGTGSDVWSSSCAFAA